VESGLRYAPYTRDVADKNQLAVWCLEKRRPVLVNDIEAEYSKYIGAYQHPSGKLEDGSQSRPPVSMI
jgi:hypothetical protein